MNFVRFEFKTRTEEEGANIKEFVCFFKFTNSSYLIASSSFAGIGLLKILALAVDTFVIGGNSDI